MVRKLLGQGLAFRARLELLGGSKRSRDRNQHLSTINSMLGLYKLSNSALKSPLPRLFNCVVSSEPVPEASTSAEAAIALFTLRRRGESTKLVEKQLLELIGDEYAPIFGDIDTVAAFIRGLNIRSGDAARHCLAMYAYTGESAGIPASESTVLLSSAIKVLCGQLGVQLNSPEAFLLNFRRAVLLHGLPGAPAAKERKKLLKSIASNIPAHVAVIEPLATELIPLEVANDNMTAAGSLSRSLASMVEKLYDGLTPEHPQLCLQHAQHQLMLSKYALTPSGCFPEALLALDKALELLGEQDPLLCARLNWMKGFIYMTDPESYDSAAVCFSQSFSLLYQANEFRADNADAPFQLFLYASFVLRHLKDETLYASLMDEAAPAVETSPHIPLPEKITVLQLYCDVLKQAQRPEELARLEKVLEDLANASEKRSRMPHSSDLL